MDAIRTRSTVGARARRAVAICASTGLVFGGAALLFTASPAGADTIGPIRFDSPTYNTGSVNGQDGWSATGPYDQAVVNTSSFPAAPASFGARSFRLSD